MSKHQRTAGVDFGEAQFGGKKYRLRPLHTGVYASMEAFIISQRPDPLLLAAEAVKNLPSSHHDSLWKAAMDQAMKRRTVTPSQAMEWEQSIDGIAWAFWQQAKEEHPEVDSFEKARQIILSGGQENIDYVAKVIEVTSGMADLKKSTGQADEKEIADPAGQ